MIGVKAQRPEGSEYLIMLVLVSGGVRALLCTPRPPPPQVLSVRGHVGGSDSKLSYSLGEMMQGLWGDLFTVCRAIKQDSFFSPKDELKSRVWPFPHGAKR